MLEPVLRAVVTELDQLVRKSLTEETIVPQYEEYFQWEYDSFEYTPNGPKPGNGHSVHFMWPNWFQSFQYLREVLPDQPYFISLENTIATTYPEVVNPHNVALQICSWVINVYLTEPTGQWNKSIRDIELRALRDLNGGPLNCSLTIAMTGLTLESERIKLNENLSIRQSMQADLETPISVNDRVTGITTPFTNNPTAHLEYKFSATLWDYNRIGLAPMVDKFIAVLRLCGTGSVQSFGYSITTDALIGEPTAREIRNGNAREKHNNYFISKKSQDEFCNTFNTLEAKLPEHLYNRNGLPKELTVAYSRYCESLIVDDYFDKRVASIAMGLEALLSDSNTEISFKLMQRCALLSGILGDETTAIKELVKSAYTVRSNFAHGAILREKDRQKYLGTFNSEKTFINAFSDLLRKFVIAFVLHDLNKMDLIKDLDKAMIDLDQHRRLKGRFKSD